VPTGNLRLYADVQYTSPYAKSVLVALGEKSLPYERVTVDLGNRAHFAPDYAAMLLTHGRGAGVAVQ
jgi:glutathione S-transferase